MVKLRKITENDIDGMLEWMHDPDIQQNFRINMKDRDRDDVNRFIANAVTWPVEGKSIHYAIADELDEYLGTISLKEIDLQNRNAEYAISLRKCAQGRGIGQEATNELLKIAFEIFDFERIYLNVLAENINAIHLYEKCGFSFEGEFRNHLSNDGKYHNLKWYSILSCEYWKLNR